MGGAISSPTARWRALARRPRPTISSSSTCACRRKVGSTFSIHFAPGASSVRCSSSLRRMRSMPRSRRCGPAPTTTSPSRLPSRSCSRASKRSRGGPARLRHPSLVVGDLALDQATREVSRAGELIELTPEGIHGARVSHAPSRASDEPNPDHRVRVGVSLRPRHEHRRRRDQSPAQEDRRRQSKKLITTVRGVGYMIKG